jgi:transposase
MLGEVATPRIDITQLPPEAAALIAACSISPGPGPRDRLARRQAGEGQLRARAPEALEVRRQDRGDDGRAARACSRTRWPRTRPACRRNWPNCRPTCPSTQDAQGTAAQATPPGAARAPAPRGAPPRARGHHLPDAECGQPMQRIGEDVSEKLDIVPAKFFVHRHIYGKWACRCCQRNGERGWCARSRPSRTWSTAASRPAGWWRTR